MFLTAKSSESDEIDGLDVGADDYIRKPISPRKLIARVKSNLRRNDQKDKKSADQIINHGPLKIDRDKYTVTLDNINIVFPRKEFEILYYLCSKPGIVFGRDKILKDVWGEDIYVVERTVDVHIRKIREKLGASGDIIETIKGVGYRIKSYA